MGKGEAQTHLRRHAATDTDVMIAPPEPVMSNPGSRWRGKRTRARLWIGSTSVITAKLGHTVNGQALCVPCQPCA